MLRHHFQTACRSVSGLLAVLVAVTCLSGCSLFVMAGKMLFGDPKIDSTFKERTGVDLVEEEKTLLVICRTPYTVQNSMPSLEYDLTDGILRRLKQRKIKTVSPDKVAVWMDENGGEIGNPSLLAKDFDCDFIAVVEVSSLSFYEENSRDMLRGHASGSIRAFEVKSTEGDDSKRASLVYSGEFTSQYPEFSPVSIHSVSERTFQKQFLNQLATQISRHFHDYRMSETVQ